MKQYMKEEELYKDRDKQILAIEGTFDASEEEVTLTLVEELCWIGRLTPL